MKYPTSLLTLIASLKKLPGVGRKSAERFAFQIINWQERELQEFGEVIKTIKKTLLRCIDCGCLIENTHCVFCDLTHRQTASLCIVATPRDVYAVEETGVFNGLYHVLGMLLSPLDGMDPNMLRLQSIQDRIQKHQITEVIIALDSTLEGDATALYLKKMLTGTNISRLALGLPIGSSLDFIDEGTLSQAFTGRQQF